MIATVEGRVGQGKTLTATAFSILDWIRAGKKIVANYNIILDNMNYDFDYEGNKVGYNPKKIVHEEDFINFDYNMFVDAMEENTTLFDTTVVIDEAYLFADARMTQSGFNRLMSYFVLQSRKRDVNIYFTTQQFENIDSRLRRNVDMRILSRFNKQSQVVTCRLMDLRSGRRRRVRISAPEFWWCYDTKEVPSLRPAHIRAVNL